MCFTSMFVEFIIFIPADTIYVWVAVLNTFYLVIL